MNRSDIGRRIERLRLKLGLSTQDLADKIGKSQATVSRIENGKQNANIEILSLIATTLRVHPFSLLTDLPLRHSALLSPTTVRSDGPMRILALTLEAMRMRSKLSQQAAATELNISVDELQAIELGYALPDSVTLLKMADLYPVDGKLLAELAKMEEECPSVSERMAIMHHYITNALHLLQDNQHLLENSPELRKLQQDIEHTFNMPSETVVSEREASYFSIGHLSDRLLEALQNPVFHEKAEELALAFERMEKAEITFDPAEVQANEE